MIKIDIPGRESLELENIVFDFNGTLAVDGKILENIKVKLNILSKLVNIYVLTADTYGSAKEECDKLNLNVRTFPKEMAGKYKREIVKSLGSKNTATVGNGFNDIEMFEEGVLAIAVIEEEGICSQLILKSDIITRSIEEALDLFIKQNRIKADLRW